MATPRLLLLPLLAVLCFLGSLALQLELYYSNFPNQQGFYLLGLFLQKRALGVLLNVGGAVLMLAFTGVQMRTRGKLARPAFLAFALVIAGAALFLGGRALRDLAAAHATEAPREAGRRASIRALVERAKSRPYEQAVTPLMTAAYEGDLAALQNFLAKGADPNERNPADMTPLDYAAGATPTVDQAHHGSAEAARVLLDHGARVDAAGKTGVTALMFAIMNGNAATARLLIERGADVNAKDATGSTPLLLAAAYGDVGVAKLLLQHGANASPKDGNGRTALDTANMTGNLGMVMLLRERR